MKRTSLTLTALVLASLTFGTAGFAEQHGGGQPGAHFVENWDYNEDGMVSLADMTEKRGDIFTTFDENEDGFMSAEEYKAFDEARAEDMKNEEGGHKGQGGHKAQKGMEMGFNDTDGDGKVSREEFLANTEKWFEMMDRNGDGGITTADFGRGN